jgi:hypothetical protein
MRRAALVTQLLCVMSGSSVFASCASSLRTTSENRRPRLHSVTPDSVEVIAGNVTAIDLHGSGFDTSRTAPENTVRIGSLLLRAVPSDVHGTVIHVAVPTTTAGTTEAPPVPWLSGRYPVSITTRAGTSDTVMLTIASRGRAP